MTLVVAITVEALVEYIFTELIVEKKIVVKQVIALAISMALCILTGADLYAQVGIPLGVPYVGSVLTGVLLSRGSNYIADFVSKIAGRKLT